VGLRVAGGYRSIGEALRGATDGAVVTIAAGRYEERLVIDRVVTLVPEQDAGSVEIHSASGITVAVAAEGVQLTGLVLSGNDNQAPVVQVQRGELALDGCEVSGARGLRSSRTRAALWRCVTARSATLLAPGLW
jgi:nitrous oxidase accessory protein NosD